MKMTGKRVLFVLTFILVIGLMLQQCWQSRSPAEKWLYFFKDAGRDYAGLALGAGRGMNVPVPDALSGSNVVAHDGHVTFSPRQDPGLLLSFSPGGPPPAEDAQDRKWRPVGDGWYVLE